MHVLESYALQDNLKIDKPSIYEKYFPMAVEGRYITLDVSSDDESNKYSHWDMVLDYMAPYLKEKNITVVQLGNKDDKQIKSKSNPNADWGLKVFNTKCGCVYYFINLLNSHYAYEEFRELRIKQNKDGYIHQRS